MKKLWIIFICMLALFACSGEEKSKKRNRLDNSKKFSQRESIFEAVNRRTSKRNELAFNSVRLQNKDEITHRENSPDTNYDDILDNGEYIGHYKVGQPYKIEDRIYFPQEYDDYEEVGVSSWYGDDFVGRQTANGEIYNSGDLTAAHQTLPLPSIVRVTNLENGKATIVRVNDRGPFAKDRIIDVSENAAKQLGFHAHGTTMVKVELLAGETKELHKNLNIDK